MAIGTTMCLWNSVKVSQFPPILWLRLAIHTARSVAKPLKIGYLLEDNVDTCGLWYGII
jgi:hypothetical protein